MNVTSAYVCRVKRPDGIHVRLQVIADSKEAAMHYALGNLKGATVSCRELDISDYATSRDPFDMESTS